MLSGPLVNWATANQITVLYIQQGKPTQNAYIERFNRASKHEYFDVHQFEIVEHAHLLATQWICKYNNEKPNTAIGGIPQRWLLNTG